MQQDTTGLLISNKTRRVKIVLLILSLLVLGVGGVVIFLHFTPRPAMVVPNGIAEKALFPIYATTWLPQGYSVPAESFKIHDDALLFYATDGKNKIAFSEQAKPKDFNFNSFYRTLNNSKSLQNVPYASILGKGERGMTLLSILTDETWLIVTTSAQGGEAYLQSIAKHIVKK